MVTSLNMETRSSVAQSRKSGRSRIRLLMTVLTLTVFLIFGAVAFILLFSSQNRLAHKSKDELIQMVCQDASSSANSLMPFVEPLFFKNGTDNAAFQRDLPKILAKELTDGQEAADEALKKIVDDGLLNAKYVLVIHPPEPPITDTTDVVLSSDESLVYHWPVPDDLMEGISGDAQYIYKPNGIPDLGIEKDGVYIIAARYPGLTSGVMNGVIGVTSIEDRVAEIDSFLASEQKSSRLAFALVMLGCLIVVFLITYVILSRLIRKRITKPIDELAVAAADVMEGKLDVDIKVNSGGDFEVLEQAFKEMVDSVHMMIERSTEEE
jgi:methyl-accepting chemotaxis protein